MYRAVPFQSSQSVSQSSQSSPVREAVEMLNMELVPNSFRESIPGGGFGTRRWISEFTYSKVFMKIPKADQRDLNSELGFPQNPEIGYTGGGFGTSSIFNISTASLSHHALLSCLTSMPYFCK